MTSDSTTMTKFCQDLKRIQSMQVSGKLSVKTVVGSSQIWSIYFYLGRIVWATGNNHRVRRWLRALKEHCPLLLEDEWLQKTASVFLDPSDDRQDYWEVQMINQALQAGVMDLPQAKAIISNYVQEAIVHGIEQPELQCDWLSSKTLPQEFLWLDVDQVLQRSMLFCNQWRGTVSSKAADLVVTPDMAPFLENPDLLQQKVSPQTFQRLERLLNGKHTFRDIALMMQKTVVNVVSSFLPLISDHIIRLQELPDLTLPGVPASSMNAAMGMPPSHKGVIACIDDSPVIAQELEAILKPLGYEVLSILDPLQSIALLIQKKPKLIFLDLVMPNTNGYELCSFFRKSAAFQNIPIVMLTGHDGMIDRLRAKVAGSTDFLSKPPTVDKVQQVIEKLIGDGVGTPTLATSSVG